MDSWRGQPTLFVSFQKQSGLGRIGDTFVVLNQPICQGAAERNYVNPLVQEIGGSLVNKRIRVGLRMVRFVKLSILPNDTMFFNDQIGSYSAKPPPNFSTPMRLRISSKRSKSRLAINKTLFSAK